MTIQDLPQSISQLFQFGSHQGNPSPQQGLSSLFNKIVPPAYAAMGEITPTSETDWFGNPQMKVYFRGNNSLSMDPANGADFSRNYGQGSYNQVMADLNSFYPNQNNQVGTAFGGLVSGNNGEQNYQNQLKSYQDYIKSFFGNSW